MPRVVLSVLCLSVLAAGTLASAELAFGATLRGSVESARDGLGSTPVTLYRAGSSKSSPGRAR